MMHLQMIGLAGAIAVGSRLLARLEPADRSWQIRWQTALTAFVVPPLFLMATAIAIVAMGTSGTPHWEGKLSFTVAAGFVAIAALLWAATCLASGKDAATDKTVSTEIYLCGCQAR